MKPKWCYNIGFAEKRDGIAIHSIGYYRVLFEECRNGVPGNGTAPLRGLACTAPAVGTKPCRPILYALFSKAECLRKERRDKRKLRGTTKARMNICTLKIRL